MIERFTVCPSLHPVSALYGNSHRWMIEYAFEISDVHRRLHLMKKQVKLEKRYGAGRREREERDDKREFGRGSEGAEWILRDICVHEGGRMNGRRER